MKGNKQIFSKNKGERIKGYKKLLKEQKDYYAPPNISHDLVEAMEAQGYKVSVEEATAYLKASYAVHDRQYYLAHNAR